MTLVCPVGDPPGVGTRYCRLCGRDYVDDTLVTVVAAPVLALPRPAMEVRVPVLAASVPAAVVDGASDLERFALQVTAPDVAVAPVDVPVVGVVSIPAQATSLEDLVDSAAVEQLEPPVGERRLLVLGSAAGFVAGLVVGAVATLGLG